MGTFFNWLTNLFRPETLQKEEHNKQPRDGSISQKKLNIPRRQNVVQQAPDIENKRRVRPNSFSEEKKMNYKKRNYKRKKRPDSKNRKQDV